MTVKVRIVKALAVITVNGDHLMTVGADLVRRRMPGLTEATFRAHLDPATGELNLEDRVT